MARRIAPSDVVLAAGGIVWRQGPNGPEVAVIHRPRHQDWTLPKGKLDREERWQDAALREAREETGLCVQLEEFAGSCSYMTRLAPKVVLYWHMRAGETHRFAPHDAREVDALEWLPVDAALARLTHERERHMLQEAVASAPHVVAPSQPRGTSVPRTPRTAPPRPAPPAALPPLATSRRGFLGRLLATFAHRSR